MTRWLLIVIALVSLLANFLPVYQYGYARLADRPTIEGMEKAVEHIEPKIEQRTVEVMQSQKDDSSWWGEEEMPITLSLQQWLAITSYPDSMRARLEYAYTAIDWLFWGGAALSVCAILLSTASLLSDRRRKAAGAS